MRIAITTSSFATYSSKPLDMLKKAGLDWVLNPHGRKLTAEEAVQVIQGCAGVIAGTEPLTAQVLARLPDLKVVSRCGVGMDNVDLKAAAENGVTVVNTPYGPTRAVAELTVAVILDLLRRVSLMDRELRAGVWKKRMGRLVQGKKIGLVGLGRIGQTTAGLLEALGAVVAYFDPAAFHDDYEKMGLNELLAWSDIVSLHCSAAPSDGPIMGERELSRMNDGAYLVNMARGGLVDEDALYAALESGRLAGAALDGFAKEPYKGPLTGLDNVILTPHAGSYAREGRVQMEIDAAANLLAALGIE